jgi:hypothetical protein
VSLLGGLVSDADFAFSLGMIGQRSPGNLRKYKLGITAVDVRLAREFGTLGRGEVLQAARKKRCIKTSLNSLGGGECIFFLPVSASSFAWQALITTTPTEAMVLRAVSAVEVSLNVADQAQPLF